jgi:AcrR family transcriptional regulator
VPHDERRHEARRAPLTRERVLDAAMAVADARGIGGLTMRSLAQALGVKPMSLYHHVAGKEEILDGLVDAVFARIRLPSPDADWKAAMRGRAASAREVLGRHPWAITLMDSRTRPGPATLRHHDAVIGALRRGGFSVAMAGHAVALLDSYIYGFALQEAALPFDAPEDVPELAESLLQHLPADEYPHLAEFTIAHVLAPGYDFGDEFAFGLDLILDALERAAGAR